MNQARKITKRITLSIIVVLGLFALWVGWKWFSIKQQDVEFKSGALTIRGSLLTPRFGNNVPGVVLVHGSGQTSRKSMLLYAWIFASQGYATLAYDKRGVGQSEGGVNEWKEFSFDDLASDAAAGYRFLQTRAGVNRQRVGFFGASQGGWVVALAANQVEPPAFLIMASASVSTVAEDRIYGREAQVRHHGFGEKEINQARELILLDHQVTRSGQGFENLQATWNQYRDAAWFRQVYQHTEPLPVNDPYREWERNILDFDPRPHLNKLKAPILWIFGDPKLDRFSPVQLSLARLAEAKATGMPYEIIQLDGAGHTLELESGGAIRSFLQVRLPLLRSLFQWLERQVV